MRTYARSIAAFQVGVLLAVHLTSAPESRGQAPPSIGGHTIEFAITSGSGNLLSSGVFRFLPSALDTSYAIVPVSGDLIASFGDYSYQTTGPSTAVLTYDDQRMGAGFVVNCKFNSSEAGSYVITNSRLQDARQQGAFTVFSGPAPLSIAGRSFSSVITTRFGPGFNSSGSFLFVPETNGIFRIVGSKAVGNHTGTYSYVVNSPTTAILWLSDTLTGSRETEQLSFKDASCGTYYLRNESKTALQTGFFTWASPGTAAPVLSAPRLTGSQFQFTFAALANRTYTVEFTPVAVPASWQMLLEFPAVNWATNIVVIDPIGSGRRYYRVQAQ